MKDILTSHIRNTDEDKIKLIIYNNENTVKEIFTVSPQMVDINNNCLCIEEDNIHYIFNLDKISRIDIIPSEETSKIRRFKTSIKNFFKEKVLKIK